MAFMVLFGFFLVITVLIVNWPTIRRTYFGPHGRRNLLALLLALTSALAAAVTVFVVRQLYLPAADETPHWWRSIQGIDAFVTTFLLVICGFLFFYFRSWYRRSPMRRFAFVTSLEAVICGAAGLARATKLSASIEAIRWWAGLLVVSVAALSLHIVKNGRHLRSDLAEFLRFEDD